MRNYRSTMVFEKGGLQNIYKLSHIVHSVVMNERNSNDTIIWIEFGLEVPNEIIGIKMPVANANLEESSASETRFANIPI
jgi:hypothetical protein